MKRIAVILFLLCAGSTLGFSTVILPFVVDTTALAGLDGSLDMVFTSSGSTTADDATLSVLNFASDGILGGTLSLAGDVTGTLPPAVISNGASTAVLLNELEQAFHFGTFIHFTLSFDGPLIQDPTASTAGSTFTFGMIQGGGFVQSADASGAVLIVDIAAGDGAVTVTTPPPNVDGGQPVVTADTSIPEPAAGWLIAGGIGVLAALRRRIR